MEIEKRPKNKKLLRLKLNKLLDEGVQVSLRDDGRRQSNEVPVALSDRCFNPRLNKCLKLREFAFRSVG
jgi:hypothetical protein